MYCKNCGKEIDDKAVICVHCGVAVGEIAKEDEKINKFGIAGFVVSLLSLWFGIYFCIASIVGLVLSVVGVAKRKNCNSANGLATAGLVIGIVSTILWVLVWLLVGSVMTMYNYQF